ncbi:MAG: hypothetical protein IKZ61_04710 [Prevotella sp.]|nr:hypothetical protein [Prevotella sp.]
MKKFFSIFILAFLANLSASAQNPYLPLWEHLPDGEPRVFEDPDNPGKFRAYIIGSHDVAFTQYCGPDIRMWSAPVEDLSQWRDEGPIFTYYIDGQWDTMYAPDLVEVKDKKTGKKTYYLYPHSRGWGRTPMVCKGDRPDGPFTPINLTEDGRRCLTGSMIDFDPSVFIENITDKKDKDYDKGFRAYVFYGFQHSTAVELDQNTMYSKREGTEPIDPFIPASSADGRLLDKAGSEYKALYEGQNPLDFNFFEASSIRQVGNKYVMVFSGYSGKEYGLGNTNSALRYAFGDSPLGPWRSGGVLVDSRGVVVGQDGSLITTNYGHNTHGSIQEINGQWYVFYHRPPRGFGYARQAMVAPVKITWDKKPVAKGGVVKITGYDPYVKDNVWMAKANDGNEYTGAEVTSEGFQIFGLPPYNYYSAGYACFVYGGTNSNEWMQDNHDVWNNSMDLVGITNGGIIGFKYFGFGGLAKDTKGVKAFEGTKVGNGTKLTVNLIPSGRGAFKIRVLLDDPWKGKEIASFDIPADAKGVIDLVADVPAVEGLTGKHAIYLVTEGPEVEAPQQPQWGRRPQQPQRPQGLYDLHGIGFGKAGSPSVAQIVPQVTITADGKKLNIPERPMVSTNASGYTECNHYQLYAPLKAGSKLEATCDNAQDAVKFDISPIVEGRATIKATYNGKTKVFLIN